MYLLLQTMFGVKLGFETKNQILKKPMQTGFANSKILLGTANYNPNMLLSFCQIWWFENEICFHSSIRVCPAKHALNNFELTSFKIVMKIC